MRLSELAELDVVGLEHVRLIGNVLDAVVKHLLLLKLALHRNHLQSMRSALRHADTAAHAVERRNGHCKAVFVLALADLDGQNFCCLGCAFCLGFIESEGAQRGVRADESTVVALNAAVGVPLGNESGNAALFVSGSAKLEGAVCVIDESGNGQGVAVHLVNGIEDSFDHLNGLFAAGVDLLVGLVLCGLPGLGNLDLYECGSAGVDRLVVHIDNVLTLLEVGCGGLFLHVADGVFLRNDLCQREECRLQNGVGALAHADLASEVDGVYHVKLDVVVCNVALGSSVKMMLKLCKIPLAVDEEHAAGLNVADDGEALGYVSRNMACNEVCLVDVVRALDLLVAEAQVTDGDAAGLLGVVLEVSLNVLVGVVADDLDGVLVSADGAVAAETPELALNGAFCRSGGSSLFGQREVSHVVNDADGELTLHLVFLKLIVNGKDGCRRSVLRAEAVAAADHLNVASCVCNGGDNVEVQRLALSAGLLGAVEDCDLLAGSRNGLEQLVRSPGTEQSYLDKADLLALSGEVVDDFFRNVADGAHCNDYAVGIGSTVVVKQLVVGAELFVDLAHVLLNDLGDSVVVLVGGLTVLEEDISVLV